MCDAMTLLRSTYVVNISLLQHSKLNKLAYNMQASTGHKPLPPSEACMMQASGLYQLALVNQYRYSFMTNVVRLSTAAACVSLRRHQPRGRRALKPVRRACVPDYTVTIASNASFVTRTASFRQTGSTIKSFLT